MQVWHGELTCDSIDCSEDEREDARRREEADRMREDGRKRFAKEIKDVVLCMPVLYGLILPRGRRLHLEM